MSFVAPLAAAAAGIGATVFSGGAALPALSLGATALSGVTGAIGAIQQGNAQAASENYQAQVARNNAVIAGQNADLVNQQAAAKVQADYRAGAIKMGAQRAALGADGGTLDSGSADDVQRSTAQATELAAQDDNYAGSLASYSLRTQQGNFLAQAGLDKAQAGNATAAGGIGALGSIIGSGSQFASKWDQYYNPGSGGEAKDTDWYPVQ